MVTAAMKLKDTYLEKEAAEDTSGPGRKAEGSRAPVTGGAVDHPLDRVGLTQSLGPSKSYEEWLEGC